jgi:hypothetical protein
MLEELRRTRRRLKRMWESRVLDLVAIKNRSFIRLLVHAPSLPRSLTPLVRPGPALSPPAVHAPNRLRRCCFGPTKKDAHNAFDSQLDVHDIHDICLPVCLSATSVCHLCQLIVRCEQSTVPPTVAAAPLAAPSAAAAAAAATVATAVITRPSALASPSVYSTSPSAQHSTFFPRRTVVAALAQYQIPSSHNNVKEQLESGDGYEMVRECTAEIALLELV